MNTKSLNRSIGLAMTALQQARANGSNATVILFLQAAIKRLNKARGFLKRGDEVSARFYVDWAFDHIQYAISAR